MRYTVGEMTVLRNLLALVLLVSVLGDARAERFLFQRGTALYLGGRDGKETRKLLDIGAGPGRLWSVSPDGRRIAWLKPLAGGDEGSLEVRPIAVFLADITGRRQKRLFSTDTLLDRQGRKIATVGSVNGSGVSTLADWAPVSLSWSADGRTLYLGCTRVGATGVMTVTVDGQAGTAIVDADGNWKCLAPITQPDARSTYLAGVSLGKESTSAPVMLCNLALGNTWTMVPPTGETPPYVAALWPALSPDGKSVAFTSVPRGLWLAEAQGTKVRRLVNGEVHRPRFSDDGKTLFFLAPRPTTADRQAYDLYELIPGSATPRVVLSDVDWFDVVPD